MLTKFLSFLIVFLFSWNHANAQFSDQIDPDFGDNGIKNYFFNIGLKPVKICVRADNKILVLLEGTAGNGYLRIVLMNENGTALESGFGIQNSQSTFGSSFGTISSPLRPTDMFLLPDQSIYIGGKITNYNPTREDVFVLKLTPNGLLDQTFGGNGLAEKRLFDNVAVNLRAHGMVVGPDESIYMSGSLSLSNIYITHFLANGTSDLEYGENGWARIQQDNPNIGTNCKMTILSDGRLVAAIVGKYNIDEGIEGDFAPGYYCFLPNGTLDSNFNNGLRVVSYQFNANSSPPLIFTIGFDEFILGDIITGINDTIYITGAVRNEDAFENVFSTLLISLLPNGEYNPSIDSFASIDTLGNNLSTESRGFVVYSLSNFDQNFGTRIIKDGNNNLILSGYGDANADVGFLLHLNSKGQPIETFANNGLLIQNSPLVPFSENIIDLGLQSNGEVICLSPSFDLTNNNLEGFYLVRFGEIGPLITSQIKEQPVLQIYPNPASDVIRIQTETDQIDTRIFSLSGQFISRFENQSTIPVSQLPNGLYLLEIKTKQSIQMHKINVFHSN